MKHLSPVELELIPIKNIVIDTLASAPISPVEGQLYYDSGDHALYLYDGSSFVDLASGGGSGAISPFTPKGTVQCATTANITLSGEQTIDGVTTNNSRVLVKNQSTASQNGLFDSNSGAWTRTVDFDSWAEVPGAWVTVQEGSTQADTIWLSTANLGGTLGSTSITWSNPFSGIGLSSTNFVADETPTGTINGSNADFVIANTPTSGTLKVYRNGVRVLSGTGNGYTLSGTTISFTTAPVTGDAIRVEYMK